VGSVRETDLVARLGGDEFVIIAEHFEDEKDINLIASKLASAVNQPYALDGHAFHITASVGIAVHPKDGDDVRMLLKNADIAMYRAKEKGRDTVQAYSVQSDPHSLERLTLENELATALERHEFELYFQPTVSLADGLSTSLEALLRWRHPSRGMLMPQSFMQMAEETGLIVPIGRWVLHEACRLSAGWRKHGLPQLPVAVNISSRQFGRSGLGDDIKAALAETSTAPHLLQLEMAESVVMQNPVSSAQILEQMKTLGVRLTMDDFGVGFSSLPHLKRFPIDRLKIDISLIREVPDDVDSAAITRALIALAHDLRCTVLAEGVETTRQLAFLRERECDEYQGYLYSRPMPADRVPSFMRNL